MLAAAPVRSDVRDANVVLVASGEGGRPARCRRPARPALCGAMVAVRVVIGTVARTGSTPRGRRRVRRAAPPPPPVPRRPRGGRAALAACTGATATAHWRRAGRSRGRDDRPRRPDPTSGPIWRASGAPVGYVRNAQHSGQRCLTGVTQPRSTQRTYSVGVLHPRRPCRLTILIHCRRRAF